MDFRRVARGAVWAAGAAAVLVLVLLLVVVAINWRDEVPSEDALRLQRVIDARPAVEDAANAYVLLLGLGVGKDEDPSDWGARRMAYMETFPASATHGPAMLPGEDQRFTEHRPASAKTLVDACREADHGCWSRLREHSGQVDAWLESEAWLLDRYLRLTGLSQWRESVLTDDRAPFPPYTAAMEGQRLLLLKSWRHASRKEAMPARDLLQRDLEFWRMVLRSSGTLISKMVATAAVQRHFTMGNLVLRELHEAGANASPPASWSMPIDRSERSMLRAFAGEWRYSKAVMASSLGQAELSELPGGVFRPLFQPQATSNLFAANMVRLIDGVDVDMADLPGAVQALELPPGGALPSLYNPIGDILGDIGYPSYLPYALRVSDLEGDRRAVLLAAQLRDEGCSRHCDADIAKRISGSSLKEPYRGAPFEWDEATGSIVFQGLQSGARGRRAVLL